MLRQQAEKINNLEQWERRYLYVIESLSQDSKQALNINLRTYDGKLK
jgi:sulfur transfer protein SufE